MYLYRTNAIIDFEYKGQQVKRSELIDVSTEDYVALKKAGKVDRVVGVSEKRENAMKPRKIDKGKQ